MLAPVLITPPAVLPVSLNDAKAHMQMETGAADNGDFDVMLTSAIEAATQALDGYHGALGRALITQTWRVRLSEWLYPIRIPLRPVQSVVVKYNDGSNVLQTLASNQYEFLTDYLGPYIYPVSGVSWPSPYVRGDAVQVDFVAGYGNNPADVPAPIRTAILMHAASIVRTRESQSDISFTHTPAYQSLIDLYRPARL